MKYLRIFIFKPFNPWGSIEQFTTTIQYNTILPQIGLEPSDSWCLLCWFLFSTPLQFEAGACHSLDPAIILVQFGEQPWGQQAITRRQIKSNQIDHWLGMENFIMDCGHFKSWTWPRPISVFWTHLLGGRWVLWNDPCQSWRKVRGTGT